jgi:predicted SprT family Zn-dependent metalloprotease
MQANNFIWIEGEAKRLFAFHSLDKEGWIVKFGAGKRMAGCCKYGKKQIVLSREYVQNVPRESILNTLLHEIAHALTPGHKHDAVWKAKALEIGCTGERCHSHVFSQAKYNLTCSSGCFSSPRHRKSDMSKKICKTCKGPILFVENNTSSSSVEQKRPVPSVKSAPNRIKKPASSSQLAKGLSSLKI